MSAPSRWRPQPDDPLFILAMDHHASFAEVLLGIETDEPSDHQFARLREAKDLIYRGEVAATVRESSGTCG